MQGDKYFKEFGAPQAVGETEKHFDPHYLAAKKSIDDRALNHHVWEMLHHTVRQFSDRGPLRILELGSGIGTMFERLVDRDILTGTCEYLATDMDIGQISTAGDYLLQWVKNRNHEWSWHDEFSGLLSTANAAVSLKHAKLSAEEIAEKAEWFGPFDLIIAHAVLDLVDLSSVLPPLLSRLTTQGLAFFSCNFDGETIFLPPLQEDEEIIKRYHDSMEHRLTGSSHTGRRLLAMLQQRGLNILAAGSSDWVIYPRKNQYSSDETYFLHAIIETVARELAKQEALPEFTSWVRRRHQQVDSGQLSFLARHLDILVQHQTAVQQS